MNVTPFARWMPSLLVAGALAFGGTPASAQTYTLKIGNATINDVQHEWQKRWGARVEKRAGGRIKVEIYPASQIGSIPRMIEGLQLGTLEAWIGPPEFVVGHDPRFQVLGAPVVILGSIYTGVCTPTEAAGIAGVYGIVVTR